MKLFTVVLGIAVSAMTALGTAQIPDIVLYEGKEYSLNSNPMEAYFAKHPEKRPKGGVQSTALWRGYRATFAVTNAVMVLDDIAIEVHLETDEGKYPYEWKSFKKDLVAKGEILKADWFTGILVIPTGELLNYVHMGYGSTYSSYILLEIKDGNLRKERKLSKDEFVAFREKQYESFKKTKAYKEAVKSMKDYNPETHENFLRSFYSGVYTSMLFEE